MKPGWLDEAVGHCVSLPATSGGILFGALERAERMSRDLVVLRHLTTSGGTLDEQELRRYLGAVVLSLLDITQRLERLSRE